LVKEHLIVKYNQALAFESFLTTNDNYVKDQMYAICNREKHEIEVFTNLNQNDNGKEGYLEMNKIKDFNSIIEASKDLNIGKSNIRGVLTNYRKTAGGFIFKYLE
jgi:hypothetical protein